MKITVFTPTYNRAYIIENLYQSLQRQTYRDFEWIVIDDGSTDNTECLFANWINECNKFTIKYYKVSNGGKHRAINSGIDLAEGKLFFIVDSDDYITDNALENIYKWVRTLDSKQKFCAIAGNKGKNEKEIIGTTFKGEYLDGTYLDRHKLGISGDKAEIFYTEILKQYKFEEFENEKFLSEASVWGKMAYEGFKTRWFNDIIYIADYLEDGLTQAGEELYANNPKGTAYVMLQQIQFENLKLLKKFSKYNEYYNLVKNNISIKEIKHNLNISYSVLFISIYGVKIKNFVKKIGVILKNKG